MLQAAFQKYSLQFKIPGGTSRGVLKTKDSWFIAVWDVSNPAIKGIGECSIIPKLSIDPWEEFDQTLGALVNDINNYKWWLKEGLKKAPAIQFGLETALKDLQMGGKRILFPSDFVMGKQAIAINGLIWMGEYEFMRRQIIEKIENGFRCIKLKIGSLNFEDELNLLKLVRKDFDANELELRVDANGAFEPSKAMKKLQQLADLKVHSIEQPIHQHQWNEMAELCVNTPLPVALDEELIGIHDTTQIRKMLEIIQPQYIIIKPSLLGGWQNSEDFIIEAEKQNVGWWVTSALEANIGLNAIAQWTATLNNPLPQGLGTGQLFTNNLDSPLFIENAGLKFNPSNRWDKNWLE